MSDYEIRHRDDPPGDGQKVSSARHAVDFCECEVGVRMGVWKGRRLLARYSPSRGWTRGDVRLSTVPRALREAIAQTRRKA